MEDLVLGDMAATTTSSTTTSNTTGKNIPKWMVSGDWFDVCKCNIPCPCEFTQTPTYEDCDGVLAYHIIKGNYGDISLDDLNVLARGSFKGNIWAGDGLTKESMALFFDEKADEAMGFKWKRKGKSSKHIRFEWNGP